MPVAFNTSTVAVRASSATLVCVTSRFLWVAAGLLTLSLSVHPLDLPLTRNALWQCDFDHSPLVIVRAKWLMWNCVSKRIRQFVKDHRCGTSDKGVKSSCTPGRTWRRQRSGEGMEDRRPVTGKVLEERKKARKEVRQEGNGTTATSSVFFFKKKKKLIRFDGICQVTLQFPVHSLTTCFSALE